MFNLKLNRMKKITLSLAMVCIGVAMTAQTVTTNWSISNSSGNPPTLPDGGATLLDNTTRNFAVGTVNGNDRVFIVTRAGGTPKVLVYNSSDGNYVGSLPTGDVITTDATVKFAVNDGEVTEDGKLLVTNMVMPGNFKVYKWDNETSTPTVALSYTFTSGRYGDNITISGNYTTGTAKVYAVNRVLGTTKVLCWSMMPDTSNPGSYIFNNTPTELFDVSANNSNPTVGLRPDGGLYFKDGGLQIVKHSATGEVLSSSLASVVSFPGHTVRYIGTEGTDEYIAYFKYSLTATTAETALERVDILKVPDGDLSKAAVIATTPSLGFSANPNGSGDIVVRRVNKDVEIFAISATNGFGKYTVKDVFTQTGIQNTENNKIKIVFNSGILSVEGINATEIELYNTLGQIVKSQSDSNKMETGNLKGLFIVKVKADGKIVKTTKVII
ncbi:hypothetical protein BSYN_20760 [Bacteroides sedimenti]|uniref:T9SS C-terminal target domain-containing protein n=2 Tax=Bacteroides sedimenti TaxID=2136147 RepID=A0ABM8IDV4_9BACE